jgi:hypothetical protein
VKTAQTNFQKKMLIAGQTWQRFVHGRIEQKIQFFPPHFLGLITNFKFHGKATFNSLKSAFAELKICIAITILRSEHTPAEADVFFSQN